MFGHPDAAGFGIAPGILAAPGPIDVPESSVDPRRPIVKRRSPKKVIGEAVGARRLAPEA
jgi:hypothetical protein